VSHVHGREALVGAWQLRSWENRADDGQVTYPMGTDALGSLLYTADNRFLS
jgi:lipocalin-like protein